MPIKLSIIIPTCNRNDLLAKCLSAIVSMEDALTKDNVEIIVTDDGIAHATNELMQRDFPGVIYTAGPSKGPAANRNHGASLAKGQWLIFTDDDCLPQPGWLPAYVAAINQYPDCLAFEGKILPDNRELLKKDLAECPVNEQGGCFWSANIMVEKALFDHMGGFDEQFKIAAQEDQDLYLRIQQHTQPVFVPDAFVVHPVRVVSLAKKISGLGASYANWILYFQKHYHQPLPAKLMGNIWDYIKLALRALAKGRPQSFVLHGYSALYSAGLFFRSWVKK